MRTLYHIASIATVWLLVFAFMAAISAFVVHDEEQARVVGLAAAASVAAFIAAVITQIAYRRARW